MQTGASADCPLPTASEAAPPTLAVVQLTVPPFLDLDPLLWFVYLEAEFENHHVRTDREKYTQLIARLPKDVSIQIRDVLLNPPATNKYQTLKEAVLKQTRPSEVARAKQLFGGLALGAQRPSALLNEMRIALGDWKIDESLLREMWMQKLPENMQGVLASRKQDSLSAAAELADELAERYGTRVTQISAPLAPTPAPPAPLQSATAQPHAPALSDPNIQALWAEIAALRRNFHSLSLNRRPRFRSRSRGPRRRNLTPPGQTTLCWYHQRFGDAAHRCPHVVAE